MMAVTPHPVCCVLGRRGGASDFLPIPQCRKDTIIAIFCAHFMSLFVSAPHHCQFSGSFQSNHTLAQERDMFSFSTGRARKLSCRPRAHTLFLLRGKMSNSLRNASILCALVLC